MADDRARSASVRTAGPADIFMRALASTVRAIAGHAQGNTADTDDIEAGPPLQCVTAEDVVRLRGRADAVALRLRYHDERLHARREVAGEHVRAAYDAIEQARVEALGARLMAGTGANIAAMIDQQCRDRRLDRAKSREQVPLADALRTLARERFCGTPPPPAARHMAELWRPFVEARIGPQLDALRAHLQDEQAFALRLQALIAALDLENPGAQAQEQRKLERRQDETRSEDTPAQAAGGREKRSATDCALRRARSGRSDGEQAAGADFAAERGHADGQGGARARSDASSMAQAQSYRAYTTDFDQTVAAEELCDAGELRRLRTQLDRQLARFQHLIGPLANRLQRRLLAQQMREWAFDLEEGWLDTGRLDRIVVSPDHGLSFKMERASAFRDTVVSLLIDNSASMRGHPIAVAAMSADILARTLERCGVKFEILGFTTRSWKGDQVRALWHSHGKPAAPGRLNELRHILYKAADTPWRRARKNLALMLRDGILKENIDGEALLWAHRRLIARPEQRRILIVISDGDPSDEATLTANPGDYLQRHLHDVIAWIERRSPVELLAIGIGHDVTRYFRRAVTLRDADELGGAVLGQLSMLFDERIGATTGTRLAYRNR